MATAMTGPVTGAVTGAVAGARHATLDTVRGVAVLGILLLNIVAFGLPAPAYFNPIAYGGETVVDRLVWFINFILFDGKMRGLFSILFGASLVLVVDRATVKGDRPARIHYARMIWLLIFGLLHLFLMWTGDILHLYALIGMIAYLFKGVGTPKLLTIGCALVVIQTLFSASFPGAVLMSSSVYGGDPALLSPASVETFGVPSPTWLAEEVALYRSGWQAVTIDLFYDNLWLVIGSVIVIGPETLAYMLFGMVAMRSGFLTGQLPRATYWRWVKWGFGITLPVYIATAAWMWMDGFSLLSVTAGTQFLPTPFRPVMAMAWAALILLLMRPGGMLTDRLAAVGRMAFTNYLVTSAICTGIFYGYGLGWFGALSRAELYLVVLLVWALMLWWSKPWLARFAFGPLEWLWRSLSRMEIQPLRRTL